MNRFAENSADSPGTGFGVAVDMGASHIRFVLANEAAEVLGEIRDRVLSQAGPEGILHQIRDGIERLLAPLPSREGFRGIAIGVPGAVQPKSGQIIDANNVPGWHEVDLGQELETHFAAPVYLDNDANMAAIGEHWRGVAKGVDNFVFVALGTGVGAGLIVNGRICRGRLGAAGEIFRMNLDWSRWEEDFPDTGYFERYVSGMGLAMEGRKVLGAGNGTRGTSLADERDARFVFEAMEHGDAQAEKLVERCFIMLGVAVANLISVLDPELIVFNGGLVRGAPEQMLATVQRVVRKIHPNPAPIKMSSLGDRAQIWGALFTLLYPEQQPVIRASEFAK
jgi:glucokinase